MASLEGRERPTGFLDLPTELRLAIYEHLFNTTNRELRVDHASFRRHGEPSITQVCQLIREEAVPVFYSTFRFPLMRYATFPFHTTAYSLYQGSAWLNHIGPEKLKMIRHLELRFLFFHAQGGSAVYDVDFHPSNLWKVQPSAFETCAIGAQHVRGIQELIEIDVKTVVAKPGVGNFTKDDFVQLFHENGYVQHRCKDDWHIFP